jgi:hypothetical protein
MICWFLSISSLRGEVDVACPGMAGEEEREVRPFPVLGVGLGTLSGQPVREAIGFVAVRAAC